MTRLVLFMLSIIVLLAACGSSASDEEESTAATNPTSAGVQPTAPQGTEDAVEEGAATGSDEGAVDACLNPVDEVSAAFGEEIAETENSSTGGGDATCFYYTVAGGPDYALATSLILGEGVQQAFDSYASDEGSEEVGGIGDQAVWSSSFEIFIVRQGDRVFTLDAGPGVSMADDPAAVRTILEELARTAVEQL